MSNGTVVCIKCGAIIKYPLIKPRKCPKCGEPIEG